MDSISRNALERKAAGWHSLAADLREVASTIRAEAERLLGPERGE